MADLPCIDKLTHLKWLGYNHRSGASKDPLEIVYPILYNYVMLI